MRREYSDNFCIRVIINNMKKRALITGVTGQDGSYLTEFLLEKGYEVHGIKRRSSSFNTERIDHIYKDIHSGDRELILHYGDLTDSTNIIRVIQEVKPDEIYNLGAQSHVQVSFETPEYTANSDAMGTLRILEAIRILGLEKKTKFYQASTSEMFGASKPPQNEETPFYPRSPYGVAKLYSHWITINYRESYGLFAVSGILFNHESPRRGETFVTRKITMAVAKIAEGEQDCLYLGNLDAKRDWGHAKDYVEAMWLMLQQEKPQDFVIATGESVSVREFVVKAFREIGVTLEFQGEGLLEKAIITSVNNSDCKCSVGQVVVKIDPKYFRPAEVEYLLGDSKKAREFLGWEPKYNLDAIVKEMVSADILKLRNTNK